MPKCQYGRARSQDRQTDVHACTATKQTRPGHNTTVRPRSRLSASSHILLLPSSLPPGPSLFQNHRTWPPHTAERAPCCQCLSLLLPRTKAHSVAIAIPDQRQRPLKRETERERERSQLRLSRARSWSRGLVPCPAQFQFQGYRSRISSREQPSKQLRSMRPPPPPLPSLRSSALVLVLLLLLAACSSPASGRAVPSPPETASVAPAPPPVGRLPVGVSCELSSLLTSPAVSPLHLQ